MNPRKQGCSTGKVAKNSFPRLAVAAEHLFKRKPRSRDSRQAKAIAFVRRHGCGSAMEIGMAAVEGEPRAQKMRWRAREAIGLNIAVDLVRKGVLKATRGNQFRLA